MSGKFKWGKLNGPGLRNQRAGLRVAMAPEIAAERAGQSIYNTQRWKKLRDEIKRARPYCSECGATSRQRRLVVDHVTEIKDGGAPYDPTNLRVLCYSCHGSKTHDAKAKRGDA